MRDDKGRAPRHQPLQRLLNDRFALRLHRAGCFVQQQDRWIGQHRDVLLARLPAMFQTWAAWIDREGACSEAEAKEEQALFEKRLKNVEGGPRAMAQLLEATRLCATLQERQSDAGFGTVLSSETF